MRAMTTYVTMVGLKGGVGKSVSALHLAVYLNRIAGGEGSVLLVDGDPNATLLDWARGGGLPVRVVNEMQAMRVAQDHEYVVLDTEARPEQGYIQQVAENSDFLVLPSEPAWPCLRVLIATVDRLRELDRAGDLKALLTIVPTWPNRDGDRAKRTLEKANIPVFADQVRRRQVYNKAAEDGVPVYGVRERAAHVAWAEYEQVGEELARDLRERGLLSEGAASSGV